jgi:glutamate racemase
MVKIGVFDSGIGGQAIADKLKTLFPDAEIIFVNDHEHVPYGTRRRAEIIELTLAAIQPLIDAGCDAIVIACNTATTMAIKDIRAAHPDVHFVGIEPMIKPAAKLTRSGVIAVFATPGTLRSPRYAQLKHTWAPKLTVLEPDCSGWATLIERGEPERIDIHSMINEIHRWKADVIVLGCTHYHWLKERIEKAAGPRVQVLEPSDAIGNRIESLLAEDFVN